MMPIFAFFHPSEPVAATTVLAPEEEKTSPEKISVIESGTEAAKLQS